MRSNNPATLHVRSNNHNEMGSMSAYQRIGDLFVAEGLLTQEQMQQALAWKANTKKRLGEVLAELGFVREDDVAAALAKQFDHPVVNVLEMTCEPEALAVVNQAFALQHLCLPLKLTDSALTVAIPDPLDVHTIDILSSTLQRRIDICLATPSTLKRVIPKAYLTSGPKRVAAKSTKRQADRAMLLSVLESDAPIAKPKKRRTKKEAA